MPANLENQQCPQVENISFHSNPKERQHQRIFKLMYNCTSHASKVILKILQARLQQSLNQEIPDVQARYRKGRGTRDQIADIPWIIHRKGKGIKKKKTKNYFYFIDYAKPFDCIGQNKVENSSRDEDTRPPYLPPEKSVHTLRSKS